MFFLREKQVVGAAVADAAVTDTETNWKQKVTLEGVSVR